MPTIRILLTAFSLAVFAGGVADENADGIAPAPTPFFLPSWFKDSFLDIGDDAQEAAESGRALMVFFHLENCPYCAKMLRDSFAADSPNAAFIREKFDCVAVDVRGNLEVNWQGKEMTEREFAHQMDAKYTPTIVFFDGEGATLLTVTGYRKPESFRRTLGYVAEKHYRRIDHDEFLFSSD